MTTNNVELKCPCDKNSCEHYIGTIFYYRCSGSLRSRNIIADALELSGYRWLDMTGGQSAFHPEGDFEKFKKVVLDTAEINCITIYELLHCYDMGVGLMGEPIPVPDGYWV